jgi:hypothetical protein
MKGKAGRTSFSKEKEATRLLLLGAVATALPQPTRNRSFLVLFFKKERLPF